MTAVLEKLPESPAQNIDPVGRIIAYDPKRHVVLEGPEGGFIAGEFLVVLQVLAENQLLVQAINIDND